MFLASILSSFWSFQFVRSGTVADTADVNVPAQVCGLFCVLFMIFCGYYSGNRSELTNGKRPGGLLNEV